MIHQLGHSIRSKGLSPCAAPTHAQVEGDTPHERCAREYRNPRRNEERKWRELASFPIYRYVLRLKISPPYFPVTAQPIVPSPISPSLCNLLNPRLARKFSGSNSSSSKSASFTDQHFKINTKEKRATYPQTKHSTSQPAPRSSHSAAPHRTLSSVPTPYQPPSSQIPSQITTVAGNQNSHHSPSSSPPPHPPISSPSFPLPSASARSLPSPPHLAP